ncbi:hypothetical protein [Streptomyces decoyicus]|uniref:hypothetical protein n=1 Tax=Streptomyces decoyicus TaxID=249567 RepID=UPI00386D9E00|nr:hypothetical protein OG532_20745 [Streptomyces decoyicus]
MRNATDHTTLEKARARANSAAEGLITATNSPRIAPLDRSCDTDVAGIHAVGGQGEIWMKEF